MVAEHAVDFCAIGGLSGHPKSMYCQPHQRLNAVSGHDMNGNGIPFPQASVAAEFRRIMDRKNVIIPGLQPAAVAKQHGADHCVLKDNMAVMPAIKKINRNLSRLADGRRILYLDINSRLADRNGKLYKGMMHPGNRLHPTLKGYQVWADALKPIFTKLLGPPGQEDHAPPPTGNPSAKP
jgi:hypothetical protein